MKGLPSTLLALFFAVFSLFSLMMADRGSEESRLAPYGQARASELGLRIVLKRYSERTASALTQRDKRHARKENSRRKI